MREGGREQRRKGLVVTEEDKETVEQEGSSSLQVEKKPSTQCAIQQHGCVLSQPHSRSSQIAS